MNAYLISTDTLAPITTIEASTAHQAADLYIDSIVTRYQMSVKPEIHERNGFLIITAPNHGMTFARVDHA